MYSQLFNGVNIHIHTNTYPQVAVYWTREIQMCLLTRCAFQAQHTRGINLYVHTSEYWYLLGLTKTIWAAGLIWAYVLHLVKLPHIHSSYY